MLPQLLLFLLLVPHHDAWKIIGPGGGGAQFLPTISPHDPKLVLVSCDMGGAYLSTDGGDSWRMFNLGNDIKFFTFDPLDPKTIYAGTGALFRSTDTGKTWTLLFPDPALVTAREFHDDEADEKIFLADGRRPLMTALAVDPADSKTLYATVIEKRIVTLFISADWGKTWQKDADLLGGGRKIYVDPRSPARNRTLYIVGQNALSVRENGRWRQGAPPAKVATFKDFSAGFSPSGGKLVVYATDQAGVYVSRDGGASWREGTLTGLGSSSLAFAWFYPKVNAVATAAGHPEVAYVSFDNYQVGFRGRPFQAVAKTADGGQSWKLVWNEMQRGAPNIKDAWITATFGSTWGGSPVQLGVAPNHSNICYSTDSGRTMRTTNGGATWEAVYSRAVPGGGYTSTGLDVTTNYGVHFDPFDRRRMFISNTDIGLFRSEDSGASWLSSHRGVPSAWVNTTYWMEFDPQIKGRAWAAVSETHDLPRTRMWRSRSPSTYDGGVVYSEDGGKTWRVEATNLPPAAVTHVLLDPKSPAGSRVLYIAAMGRGVFKSSDGGRTWAVKNAGIEGREPLAWRLTRDADGALYVIVVRQSADGSYGNRNDGALYRSTDGAEHWQKLPLPDRVNGPNGLAIDPADPRRLYLAAWGLKGLRGTIPGGIFLSTNRGQTWKNVLSKDQHLYDITIDPANPKILYACGFESSAWRSVDRGETWSRIQGYNFKAGHRVISDPDHPGKIYITTFGGGVWHGPAN